MNKTEILNIVNEPSKHIQIVKIDGKDSIVYSSKFVELLELIPTMLTKADLVAMLNDLADEISSLTMDNDPLDIADYIREKINTLKENKDGMEWQEKTL